jgi:hypothetical protein
MSVVIPEQLLYHLQSYDGTLAITSLNPTTTNNVTATTFTVTYTWTWLPGDVPQVVEASGTFVDSSVLALLTEVVRQLPADPNGLDGFWKADR